MQNKNFLTFSQENNGKAWWWVPPSLGARLRPEHRLHSEVGLLRRTKEKEGDNIEKKVLRKHMKKGLTEKKRAKKKAR